MTLAHRDALLSELCGQRWPYRPLLDALDLPINSDILDIGAGAGQLLMCLHERGHQGVRVGLDPVPGPGVLCGQAETLAFPDASFEVVLFVRSLFHVTDSTQALREALRVLQPGGKLVVAVQGGSHLMMFWSLFGPPPEGNDPMTQRVLQEAGLQPARQDIYLAVNLSPKAICDIARTYALPEPTFAPGILPDRLHLATFVFVK
ncbi:class I SAM-dependent methyltransferase [Deinococcus hopiensis]|uniref:Methylase involved in ubiquinone/menaquinone biosynthesis n=1 Tax=Deinococcus hopiensis KR-140 TaxID=695939 RepID=A0A1W1UPN3_9DEIO|nr:class I SAM-dependent methyltransferase [Deinococcus hopiensis]SMB82781.1 Methylase involved in ubiquinone/menaquinone biosynthesis [Deinococcus hopiensis KR-140]